VHLLLVCHRKAAEVLVEDKLLDGRLFLPFLPDLAGLEAFILDHIP